MASEHSGTSPLPDGIVEDAIQEAEHTIIRIEAAKEDIPAELLADTVRRELYAVQGEDMPEVSVE